MTTVTVCVGSSCHVKGARQVIMRFDELLTKHGLKDRVTLQGSFCMERCGEGINWQIEEEPLTSASAEEAVEVFRKRIVEPLATTPSDGPGGSAHP